MSDLTVRGNASAEEVAAVLAVLRSAPSAPPASAYERWRAGRLKALGTARGTIAG